MSSQSPVARDVAEAEFARWASAMGLTRKLDPSKFDDADKRGFLALWEGVVGAIEDGNLVVDQDGQFIFTPTVGDAAATQPIVFREPDGAVLKARDQAKDPSSIEARHKVLAAMTGQAPVRYAKMKTRDLWVCEAILTLFLA